MSYNKFKSTTIYGDLVIDKKNEEDPIPTFQCKAPAFFFNTVTGLDKSTVGLSFVDNTTDLNKPVSSATELALTLKANDDAVVKLTSNQIIAGDKTFSGITSGITKSMVGLSDVDNTSDENKPVSSATQILLDLKANDGAVVKLSGNQTIAGNKTFSGTTSGISKAMIGLGNVDNTSDANKPISSAAQTALNLKANDSSVVKLSGNQNIAGIKTFNNAIFADNLITALHGSFFLQSRADITDTASSKTLDPGGFYIYTHASGTRTLTIPSNSDHMITEIRNLNNGSIVLQADTDVILRKTDGTSVTTISYNSTICYIRLFHRTSTEVIVLFETFKP